MRRQAIDERAGQGARRPSKAARHTDKEERSRHGRRQEVDPPVGEELLAYRYENGLDLWTGLPLAGQTLKEWEAFREENERQAQQEQHREARGLDALVAGMTLDGAA
jgi:hypothetical protein